MKKIVKIIF